MYFFFHVRFSYDDALNEGVRWARMGYSLLITQSWYCRGVNIAINL